MTRRELLTAIAAAVPAAATRIEPRVGPNDLVVIEHPGTLDDEELACLHAQIRHGWLTPNEVRAREDLQPRILVLTDGAKLQVHRGVARVELPDA